MTTKKIIGSSVIVVIILFTTLLLLDRPKEVEYDLADFANKSTEEILEDIKKKDFEELIKDINGYDFPLDAEPLLYYAAEIMVKVKDVEEKDLVKAVKDKDNSEIVRITIIQACTAFKIGIPYEEVVSLVYDEETSLGIKKNLLINNAETGANIELLKDIAASNDELAAQALKLLGNEGLEDALAIAKETLNSYEDISDVQLMEALDVMALALRERYSSLEEGVLKYHGYSPSSTSEMVDVEEFIAICDYILNNRDAKEAKYGVIFALSDALNEETITYIVESDLIDPNTKISCVDQNMVILKGMLEETPTPEKISVVLKAMEIMPLNDLREPLERLIATVDSEMEEAIWVTLENIDKNGEDSVVGVKMFE